jgi:DNA-damage-inducible protein J
MAKSANLYIRIDPETKTENLFASFGITITDAVNMFLNKSIMVGGLPFDPAKTKHHYIGGDG